MTTYEYKRQGDGRDSWTVTETDQNGNVLNKYMVYEDPNKPAVPNVDVVALLQSLPQEQIEQIRQILNP